VIEEFAPSWTYLSMPLREFWRRYVSLQAIVMERLDCCYAG